MLAATRGPIRAVVAALMLTTLLACGDDVVFFSVSFGIVVGNPVCVDGGGQFDLRDQGGLILVVIISDDTRIIAANGLTAHCSDITTASQVQVNGHRDGTTIAAKSVQLP